MLFNIFCFGQIEPHNTDEWDTEYGMWMRKSASVHIFRNEIDLENMYEH